MIEIKARHSDFVVSRLNDDDTVSILHVERMDEVIQLDGLAAKIWMMIDGERTFAEIAARIASENHVPRGAFRANLSNLVTELIELRLIECRPA